MISSNNTFQKNLIPVILFLSVIISCSLTSQNVNRKFSPGIGSDTLLFDGDSPTRLGSKTDNCPVKVTYSKGTTKGKRIVQKLFQVCVNEPSLINVEEDGPLNPDDVLAPGSNITTGDNSAVELKF